MPVCKALEHERTPVALELARFHVKQGACVAVHVRVLALPADKRVVFRVVLRVVQPLSDLVQPENQS